MTNNGEFKKQLSALRRSQTGCGISAQRKGNGPRSHMTIAAKALTISCVHECNLAAGRWPLIVSMVANVSTEQYL